MIVICLRCCWQSSAANHRARERERESVERERERDSDRDNCVTLFLTARVRERIYARDHRHAQLRIFELKMCVLSVIKHIQNVIFRHGRIFHGLIQKRLLSTDDDGNGRRRISSARAHSSASFVSHELHVYVLECFVV